MIYQRPINFIQALATCHSLVKMDRDLVGDPLEQAMLKAVEWDLSKGRTTSWLVYPRLFCYATVVTVRVNIFKVHIAFFALVHLVG